MTWVRLVTITVAIISSALLHVYSQDSIQVGYAVVESASGRSPAGLAFMAVANSQGILISQTSFPAATPIRQGRLPLNETTAQTGVALVNPGAGPASVNFVLRDSAGNEIARRSLRLDPRAHTAMFVSSLFGNVAQNIEGTLSFESDQPLAVVGLRQRLNAHGELVYSAIAPIDLAPPAPRSRAVFPHVVSGGGYSTEIILVNTTTQRVRGKLKWVAGAADEFVYTIEPQGVHRTTIAAGPALRSGFMEVSPETGPSPTGHSVIELKTGGQLISETVISDTSATSLARVPVDTLATETSVVIANSREESASVTLTLIDRSGERIASASRTLPASGYANFNVMEIFPETSAGFTGEVEIASSSPTFAAGLRRTVNARNDVILNALAPANLTLRPVSEQVFPHVVLGGGFSMRMLLTNTDPLNAASGRISFFQPNGAPLDVGGESYRISAGGRLQFFPGNTAAVNSVTLRDPVSNEPSSELTVNEGSSVRPRFLVIDSMAVARDDIEPQIDITNAEVATADSEGRIIGHRPGFSTVTVSLRDIVVTATVSVVGINAGVRGFDVAGIVVDSARRLYLASASDHAILFAQDLQRTPTVFAGTRRSSGLRDELRLQSQFRNPAQLAVNHADGSIYVSDGGNHAIRRVQPGPQGRVTTIAGTGAPGREDGPARQAGFSTPNGIALDNRGNLWIADSDNHTIRRLNLITGDVRTVAGSAGTPGLQDGRGSAARFNSPAGIAIEHETAVQEMIRELSGQPPPPVRVIVADSANGVLRRVSESGEVETIRRSSAFTQLSPAKFQSNVSDVAPNRISLNSPTSVAVDASGTIFVAEADDVRAILPDGTTVRAAQARTIGQPRAVATGVTGRLVISSSTSGAQEIYFGEPRITAIAPDVVRSRGGTSVTIRGVNFAPESIVVAGGSVIRDARILNSETISFVAPVLPSGRLTLTVQNRGGLAQTALIVEPVPLDELRAGEITTIAGGATFTGDGGSALEATVGLPEHVAVDSAGNTYIADTANHRIRKVNASTGVITTIAGNGTIGLSGDNGPAVAASMTFPAGLAVDTAGNVYIADTGNSRIRRVDAATGIITTIAGRRSGFSGDGGPATAAELNAPRGLALDAAGSVYIADSTNHRIRRIDPNGAITTVAGNGRAELSGDGQPAMNAALNSPRAVAFDVQGNLWIADTFNHRIRRIDSSGAIHSITAPDLNSPRGIAVMVSGEVIVSDSGNRRIRKIDRLGNTSTIADAPLNEPYGIAIDGAGILVIADRGNNRVRKIVEGEGRFTPFGILPGPPVMVTVAGNGQRDYIGDDGLAIAASFRSPSAIAIDTSGNVFIADTANHRVRGIDKRTGIVTTIAGTGQLGFSGDGGPATLAALNSPQGLAVDRNDNLYIADTNNHRIRKVDRSGGIVTFAGSVQLSFPTGLAIAGDNLYIADTSNHRVRRVNTSTGAVVTIGETTEDSLNSPRDVALDSSGNLFIADTGNNRIRKIDTRSLSISTIGTAVLNFPLGLDVDAAGSVVILDSFSHVIRKVESQSGAMLTIAGTGTPGFSGDGGPAVAATMFAPGGVRIDPITGNILFTDTVNNRIRGIRKPN